MLEAAYYASGGKKDRPFTFHWPTPKQLAAIERTRQRIRANSARNREQRTRQARERRAENPAISRTAAAVWRLRHLDKAAAYARKWRKTETGIRAAQHQTDQRGIAAAKAAERAKKFASALTSCGLADLEAPRYLIEDESGKLHVEQWPMHDEADQLISFADAFAARLQHNLDHLTPTPQTPPPPRCQENH
jgi:hypothetical protein